LPSSDNTYSILAKGLHSEQEAIQVAEMIAKQSLEEQLALMPKTFVRKAV
jgi:hypothetical protein